MEYPGNAALSDDIKERIVSTFQQTVETARVGNQKEALLGCDFILKLDPEFSPAQELQERLQVSSPGESLVPQLRSLLTARRFEEAMQLAQDNAAAVSSHATLQVLAQEAQSRLEAEPYVKSFLDKAGEALATGDPEEAGKDLAKARALDPHHPRLLELDKKLETLAKEEESGSSFSLDLEEPVTSFTLGEPDPLAAFALSADESDPSAALSDPESQEPAPEEPTPEEADPLDDPLAAFALPVGEPPAAEKIDDDPFAALSGAFDEAREPAIAGPAITEPEGATDEILDDPFAAFSESDEPGGVSLDDASSGDARVSDLLTEGQAAFDRGDHQGAIDAWSRIFLIDLDNEEASRRIETARQLKAESERQVEEIYHEGLAAWKGGSLEEAKQAFEKVVSIEPGHARAQEHLERIAAGETPDEEEDLAASLDGEASPEAPESSLLDEILVPPDPGATPFRDKAPPVEPSVSAKRRGNRINRKFVLIALVVLLAVGVGGGYLFSNRDAFFPNSETPDPASKAEAPATPLDRARKLHEGGKTKLAIAQLKRLPTTHPSYEQAQGLLAEWSAALAPPAAEEPGMAQELVDSRDEWVKEAYRLESEGEFLEVKKALAAAAEIAPLGGEEAALWTEAEERLEPLQSEIRAMAERDFNFALKSLWRKHTADPANRDVVRLLVNCYYNVALRDLQRGDQDSAVENLDEALALAPDDDEATRHRRFAQAYLDRPTDLLYRIYVKYLPYR